MRLAALTVCLFAALAAPAAAEPLLTVAAIHAAPPVGQVVRVIAVVVDSYDCPPCPPGMTCKPCLHATSITIADPKAPKGPTLLLSVPWRYEYLPGRKFFFVVTVGDRARDGFDGHAERMGRP